jgi:hypothetical protein
LEKRMITIIFDGMREEEGEVNKFKNLFATYY